jgi:hypothetical protein
MQGELVANRIPEATAAIGAVAATGKLIIRRKESMEKSGVGGERERKSAEVEALRGHKDLKKKKRESHCSGAA